MSLLLSFEPLIALRCIKFSRKPFSKGLREKRQTSKDTPPKHRKNAVLFSLSSLPYASKAASFAPKIPRIFLDVGCEAVFKAQILSKAKSKTAGNLTVAEDLRYSIRDNLPSKTDVS